MRRRDALKTSSAAAVAGLVGATPAFLACRETKPGAGAAGGLAAPAKSRRQRVLDLLDEGRSPDYVPAAFFLHFGEEHHVGQPAIDKHTEYFRATGMDFVKIQYEAGFPKHPEVETPGDWAKMPLHGEDFYAAQVGVVEGLVKALKEEALVVCTLYSPFMLACESVGAERVVEHIEEDPEAFKKGLDTITESVVTFTRECARVGVDGFYASTQGGEAGRFSRPGLFREWIMPSDLTVQNEINETCPFNILHVCDYHLPYDDFTPFVDYPGDVVNSPLHLAGKPLAPKEAGEMFGRPFMGGLDRKGVIVDGTPDQIREEVSRVLARAGDRHILGADCTVPGETPWENLRIAIDAAHAFRG